MLLVMLFEWAIFISLLCGLVVGYAVFEVLKVVR
jgi:hypothetical protein